MDQIFDRLGNLLKATLQSGKADSDFEPTNSPSDPDLAEAWAELDDFLNSDTGSSGGFASRSRPTRPAGESHRPSIPASVREAYETIGASHDATNEEIARAYKSLLLKHHPDRFATDPDKLAQATERTKLLNRAFQEIKRFRSGSAT